MANIRYIDENGNTCEIEAILLTGVTDINGIEVKEGDVVRVFNYNNVLIDAGFSYEEIKDATIEDVKGELVCEYIAEVKWDAMQLVVEEIKKEDQIAWHIDYVDDFYNVLCNSYSEIEVIERVK